MVWIVTDLPVAYQMVELGERKFSDSMDVASSHAWDKLLILSSLLVYLLDASTVLIASLTVTC